jgi:hypothetical protein
MSVSSKIDTDKKEGWIDLIGQSCRTSDNQELGHLEAISNDFIVIRKEYLAIHTHYYYIPYDKVQGWDGNIIWLGISKAEVEQNYKKHKAPDPKQYYVKGGAVNRTSSYPEVILIPSESKKQVFTAADQRLTPTYKCDLCSVSFNTDNELSSHVIVAHS